MLNQLKEYFQDPELHKQKSIQSLWSGYGEIAIYSGSNLTQSIIVKHVKPPKNIKHPRGWHGSASHMRKINSYEIEANFYSDYAQRCDDNCRVPGYIKHFQIPAIKTSHSDFAQVLIMENLNEQGFSRRVTSPSLLEVKQTIRWLAYFHVLFMQKPINKLWNIGTYWHLDTRVHEYNAMPLGPLKDNAYKIDNTLNNAQFKTLLHGDAKLANFCFDDKNSSSNNVAAVDFQYVGQGVGVKDLCYLLGSCFNEENLFKHHEELLSYYFNQLECANTHYGRTINVKNVEQEWRNLYPVACADFNRFLQGWSPNHPKINRYLEYHTKLAIKPY